MNVAGRPSASPLTLLCLPCAGASATMYLRWRRFLPASVHLVPAELPGRGARLGEPPMVDFSDLVERLCDEQADAMRGPFVLFGHSMGALLAHGMVRRLHDAGRTLPRALMVSGCAAPSRRMTGRLAGLDDDASLIADLRRQGGTSEEVFAHEALMRLTLDVLRADYQVCRSFVRPMPDTPPLPLTVHVFAGRRDDIAVSDILAWSGEAVDVSHDWFDGGHFFLRQDEAAFEAVLARRLAALAAPGLSAREVASSRDATLVPGHG